MPEPWRGSGIVYALCIDELVQFFLKGRGKEYYAWRIAVQTAQAAYAAQTAQAAQTAYAAQAVQTVTTASSERPLCVVHQDVPRMHALTLRLSPTVGVIKVAKDGSLNRARLPLSLNDCDYNWGAPYVLGDCISKPAWVLYSLQNPKDTYTEIALQKVLHSYAGAHGFTKVVCQRVVFLDKQSKVAMKQL
jgi:hypothetical protein